MQKQILGVAIAAALLSGCSSMNAAQEPVVGPIKANASYQADSEGNVLISQYGECIRTGSWSKDASIDACEGVKAEPVVEKAPEPAPAPKTVVEKMTAAAKALFAFDSSRLTSEGRSILDSLAGKLTGFDAIEKLTITGHTDSIGSERYNQGLSERRADAVRAYIVKSGAAGDAKIVASGMGEAAPVASNATSEGRQQNRRVDVEVLGSKTVTK